MSTSHLDKENLMVPQTPPGKKLSFNNAPKNPSPLKKHSQPVQPQSRIALGSKDQNSRLSFKLEKSQSFIAKHNGFSEVNPRKRRLAKAGSIISSEDVTVKHKLPPKSNLLSYDSVLGARMLNQKTGVYNESESEEESEDDPFADEIKNAFSNKTGSLFAEQKKEEEEDEIEFVPQKLDEMPHVPNGHTPLDTQELINLTTYSSPFVLDIHSDAEASDDDGFTLNFDEPQQETQPKTNVVQFTANSDYSEGLNNQDLDDLLL